MEFGELLLQNNQQKIDETLKVEKGLFETRYAQLVELYANAVNLYGEDHVYIVPVDDWEYHLTELEKCGSFDEMLARRGLSDCSAIVFPRVVNIPTAFRRFKPDVGIFQEMKDRYFRAVPNAGERTIRFFFFGLDKDGTLIGDWTANKYESDFDADNITLY